MLPGWNGQKVLGTIRKGNKPLRGPLSFRSAGVAVGGWVPLRGVNCVTSLCRSRHCSGRARSQPAALGVGPLASATSSSVRLSAGQAACLCRCSSSVGQHADPSFSSCHSKHPTFPALLTPSVSSCSVCVEGLRSGFCSWGAGAPQELWAGVVLLSWGGEGRINYLWRARRPVPGTAGASCAPRARS